MHIGQLLMGGANVLSHWFPREADNAIFSWEQVQVQGGVTLAVTVWHKNTEETGEGDEITGEWDTDGNIRFKKFTGLKELVRFEFTVSTFNNVVIGTVQFPGGTDADVHTPITQADIGWILYRMLSPTWFNTAS